MNQIEAENAIKKRVLDAINDSGISVNKLAASLGISQTTLNDQIRGSSKISAATLVSLANFRPELSAEWLLRGVGTMYLSDENCSCLTPAKITLELEVSQDQVIKLRLKDKVVQLAD